jgi:hypothetical protein
MAKTYVLKSPCAAAPTTICSYFSKYYVWNAMADTVWEIMTSMDLVDIVTKIAKLGLRSLKIKRIYGV